MTQHSGNDRTAIRRRGLLAAVAVGAVAPVAGCLGDDEAPTEPEYGDWFDNVPQFDGFVDRTDEDSVTVLVGAGENGFRFDPPAVTVSPETAVVFEWTGNGGTHNIEEPDGAWENPSGLVESADHSWERTFEDAGTHRYQCWPHRGSGMKGAIFVDAHAE